MAAPSGRAERAPSEEVESRRSGVSNERTRQAYFAESTFVHLQRTEAAPDSGKSRSVPEYPRMAPIPVWSGNLRLSLVLVPVRMFPATSTEGTIAFRMIHEPSGQPIKYLKGIETERRLRGSPRRRNHQGL